MQSLPGDMLREWHDFYVLVGTASATLVGLMFVSASIGANFYNESHSGAMKAFVTPTVVSFSSALVVCVLVTIPSHSWASLAGLLGAGALLGLIYSGRILVALLVSRRFAVDLSDSLFYALVPVAAYAALAAAAVLLYMQSTAGPNVVAAVLLVMLLAGIRNAWDMTLWIMLNTPTK
ncbi:MAG: hypothetical protein ABSG76_11855 [Xanthobacteraceae bacterium]